nr:MAG TPA: hypothetical protein [Caudoviricetes sp.]
MIIQKKVFCAVQWHASINNLKVIFTALVLSGINYTNSISFTDSKALASPLFSTN